MNFRTKFRLIGRSLTRAGAPGTARLPGGGYVLSGFAFGLIVAAAFATFDERYFFAGMAILIAVILAVVLLARFAEHTDVVILNPEVGYRTFFQDAVEGIFRTTPSGRYLAVNKTLARMYGYPSPDAMKDTLTDIAAQLYVAPGRRDEFKAIMAEHDKVTDFVSEIRRSDGSTIWISENARAIRDWAGRIVCYEGTVEDVTKKIEAENVMRCALKTAETANRAKNAFFATMNHELRTPLNAIIGFSEIIEKEILGAVNPPQYRTYATDIRVSGVRLLAIVNDILDASRLEGGTVKLNPEPVTIGVLVRDAIAAAHTFTGDMRPVAVSIDPAMPELFVDPYRFRQCIVKLVSNALKFTPEGGTISLRVRHACDGGMALTVEDTGIGMEADKIAAAFEMFSQIDNSLSRRFGGIGLGLSITKALVEMHGGRLVIESTVGRGTAATIRLPKDRLMRDKAAVA